MKFTFDNSGALSWKGIFIREDDFQSKFIMQQVKGPGRIKVYFLPGGSGRKDL